MLNQHFIKASIAFREWHLFVPMLATAWREGYGFKDFRADSVSGLTVAIVALPLAMALGIASGATPEQGLITLIVAGFLISLLGGSRFQIGGPTGAFVVVVFNVISQFGYDGLILSTLMAGVMIMIAGFMRLGTWIKYIPQPVITGFTSGIAVIIFSSQIKDLFGLHIEKVPAGFFEKWYVFWLARDTLSLSSLLLSLAALLTIILLRRFSPRLPGFLISVAGASAAVWLFNLQVPTIGTEFGGISRSLPMPHLPAGFELARLYELLPSAFTIAFLAGIESLLSAVVADGMTGRRHRSNCELVAQGVANVASALFGGMPATGAIARTATNIRSGARTPVAGVLHAVFVLLFMLVFAPLASYIPLASLAVVLVIVAWNMSEFDRFLHLMRAPLGDKLVLLVTFFLTVIVDLTVAIQAGVVMAAILFMHRMSQAVEMSTDINLVERDVSDMIPVDKGGGHANLPPGIEAFQIRGPFFFGVASRLLDTLDHIEKMPKVFILRLGLVPLIDASGEAALKEFVAHCRKRGTIVILSRIQGQPGEVLRRMGLLEEDGVLTASEFRSALKMAIDIMAKQ